MDPGAKLNVVELEGDGVLEGTGVAEGVGVLEGSGFGVDDTGTLVLPCFIFITELPFDMACV